MGKLLGLYNRRLTGLQLPIIIYCSVSFTGECLNTPLVSPGLRWSWSPGYMNNIDYLESLSNHNIICKECCNTTHHPPLPPSHPAHLVNINISLLSLAHSSELTVPILLSMFLTDPPLPCQSWQLPPESLDKASLLKIEQSLEITELKPNARLLCETEIPPAWAESHLVRAGMWLRCNYSWEL